MSSVLGCMAQNAVYPLSERDNYKSSLAYYLPKSDVEVVVKADKIVEKPGPFYKYAERYLGLTDVIVRERTTFKLASTHLNQKPVADVTKGYIVVQGNKGIMPLLYLTPDKVISGVNLPAVNFTPMGNDLMVIPQKHSQSLIDTAITFNMSLLGEDALQANSIPKMAELAAKQIYRIREARTSYLTGDVEHQPDGAALKLILEQMDKQEAELVALFAGKRVTVPTEKRFDVKVDGAMNNYIVCRISTLQGILAADDLLGSPIYMSVKPEYVKPVEVPNKKKTKVEPTGYTFNTPGYGLVTVTDNQDLKVEAMMVMPQFGIVEALPVSMCNDIQLRIVYNTHTGQIFNLQY